MLSSDVPIVSVFFGIVVRMHSQDHEPAHFHVEHQGQHAKFDFTGSAITGSIQSRTALRLIRGVAQLHRSELAAKLATDEGGPPAECHRTA